MNCGGEPECNLYLPGQNSSETGHEADWKTGNLPSSRVSQTGANAFDRRVAGQSLHFEFTYGRGKEGRRRGWDGILPLETRCLAGVGNGADAGQWMVRIWCDERQTCLAVYCCVRCQQPAAPERERK